MGNVAIPSTMDNSNQTSSSISSNHIRPKRTPRLFLVRPIHMLHTVAIRITLRYGTLAFKQIKVNKTKAFKVLPAPDRCCVMLCCESTNMWWCESLWYCAHDAVEQVPCTCRKIAPTLMLPILCLCMKVNAGKFHDANSIVLLGSSICQNSSQLPMLKMSWESHFEGISWVLAFWLHMVCFSILFGSDSILRSLMVVTVIKLSYTEGYSETAI